MQHLVPSLLGIVAALFLIDIVVTAVSARKMEKALPHETILTEILAELRHLGLLEHQNGQALAIILRELGAVAQSAKLTFVDSKGEPMANPQVQVGQTASSNFQEFSGPNQTGQVLPNAGAIALVSDNPSVVAIDPATGKPIGVAVGTANITGTDQSNGLSASAALDVVVVAPPVAQSASLTLTPDPLAGAPAAQAQTASVKKL